MSDTTAIEWTDETDFPPERCNAWEDCQHDGICHDPTGCGAKGPNHDWFHGSDEVPG